MLFGEFVRERRKKSKMTIRTFSALIGISPVYQSSIENGKRPAPSYKVLQKMVKELRLSPEETSEFYDLANQSGSKIAISCDIADYVNESELIRRVIRGARDGKITGEQLLSLLPEDEE